MSVVELEPVPVYAGDGLRIELGFDEPVDPDDATAGVAPMNLSGWTWSAQWRTSHSSGSAVSFVVDSSDAATGQLVLTLTGQQTAAMFADGVFDLQGTKPGAQPWTPVWGRTVWQPDVTRG